MLPSLTSPFLPQHTALCPEGWLAWSEPGGLLPLTFGSVQLEESSSRSLEEQKAVASEPLPDSPPWGSLGLHIPHSGVSQEERPYKKAREKGFNIEMRVCTKHSGLWDGKVWKRESEGWRNNHSHFASAMAPEFPSKTMFIEKSEKPRMFGCWVGPREGRLERSMLEASARFLNVDWRLSWAFRKIAVGRAEDRRDGKWPEGTFTSVCHWAWPTWPSKRIGLSYMSTFQILCKFLSLANSHLELFWDRDSGKWVFHLYIGVVVPGWWQIQASCIL
jgi:hypothetical protein